jgi:hypothetical protein
MGQRYDFAPLRITLLGGLVLGAVGGAIGLSLARARKPVLRREEQTS